MDRDPDPWAQVRKYELKDLTKTGPELGRGSYGVVQVCVSKELITKHFAYSS